MQVAKNMQTVVFTYFLLNYLLNMLYFLEQF